MIISKWLVLAALSGAAAGAACTQETADKAKQGSDTALDAAKEGVEKAAEVTKDVAQTTADQTKEIAAAAGRKTEAVVSATGDAITDGWITTKVSTAFVDESVLKGSDIDVDTDDRVVTLKGTVKSDAAKMRAAAIAGGTEGVARVVNQLVVEGN